MTDKNTKTDSGRTVIVRVAPQTHRALRIRVAEEDTSIQKWVEGLIERELKTIASAQTTASRVKGG